MTTTRLSPENYARVTATVTHATLKLTVETAYPDLSPLHQSELITDVICRLARMRGYEARYVASYTNTEDSGE